MEDWYEAQRRQDAERKAKRERADLEYERDRAQEDAQRAERDAREARERAARERAAAQEEVEYAREAEAEAEAEARKARKEFAAVVAAVRLICRAWDGVLPEGGAACGVDVPSLAEAIERARKACGIPSSNHPDAPEIVQPE